LNGLARKGCGTRQAKTLEQAGKTAGDEKIAQNAKAQSLSMPDVSDWSGLIKKVNPN